jgi:hypothetical protein
MVVNSWGKLQINNDRNKGQSHLLVIQRFLTSFQSDSFSLKNNKYIN